MTPPCPHRHADPRMCDQCRRDRLGPTSTDPDLNTQAAQRVHYTDPRVRRLAYARYHLATGGTRMEWLAPGPDNPDALALISEAQDWLRAAVAAGLLPPPGDAP